MEEAPCPFEEEVPATSWKTAALLTLWPIPLTVAQCLVLPGYLNAFLAPDHPACRMLFFTTVMWMLLGFFAMRQCKGFPLRWLVFLVFPCPAMMVMLVGPALIALIESLPTVIAGH